MNVSELYRMEELLDGAEIYSKIRETDNAAHYTALIHNRASIIMSNKQDSLTII